MSTTRQFHSTTAVRESVPLLIGLMGCSSSGKTFSALRLATGIQRVTGGDIYVIDTESRRALHYADQFKFEHVAFDAPFGSLDYLAAMKFCADRGAKVIVIDSMSHEHSGPGGYLLTQEAELDRMFAALSEGGQTLMPLGNYGFSKKFGWCNDRFGVSWQITLDESAEHEHHITPSLMFCGDANFGRAEEAMARYVGILGGDSAIGKRPKEQHCYCLANST